MNPSQVARALRQIATRINNSKQPNHRLVVQDLRRVLLAVEDAKSTIKQETITQNKYTIDSPQVQGVNQLVLIGDFPHHVHNYDFVVEINSLEELQQWVQLADSTETPAVHWDEATDQDTQNYSVYSVDEFKRQLEEGNE
jgi:hypothetical protein